MPTKRPAYCYKRAPKKPYTRKEYVKSRPQPRLRIFEIGKKTPELDCVAYLVSLQKAMLLDRALETARVTANRYLTSKLGRGNFFFRIRPYPHHIVRETRFLGIAGADRIQSGMKKAFGKPVDRAAIIKQNQIILEIWVREKDLNHALEALRRAKVKLGIDSELYTKKHVDSIS
ncbi:MAG: 50S ribosomal protein L16 [Candidatus Njordarchaeum guaymaensis]|nr:50S ribosomal protein L16 [Candidatus Korarchaeota archaeon]